MPLKYKNGRPVTNLDEIIFVDSSSGQVRVGTLYEINGIHATVAVPGSATPILLEPHDAYHAEDGFAALNSAQHVPKHERRHFSLTPA